MRQHRITKAVGAAIAALTLAAPALAVAGDSPETPLATATGQEKITVVMTNSRTTDLCDVKFTLSNGQPGTLYQVKAPAFSSAVLGWTTSARGSLSVSSRLGWAEATAADLVYSIGGTVFTPAITPSVRDRCTP